LLKRQSISDLKSIRATLIEKQVKIGDLPFLIGNNGRIVIANPLKITTGVKPNPANLKTIDKLIEAASKR